MKKKIENFLSSLYQKDGQAFDKLGDTLNYMDEDGRSLIFYSVFENDILTTHELIKKGADLDIVDNNGWTPLHYSVNEYLIEITKLLIENGASINAKDSYGNNVIWRAVFASRGRGDLIEFLLKNGANANELNDSGISARNLAERIGNYDVFQFFKEK